VRPAEPVTAPDGTRLAFLDQRPTTSDSVFGKVRSERHDFTAPGQEGRCPLDAELSLPARGYSALLRGWTAYGATDESYRESQAVIERILGLSLSLQAVETAVVDTAGDVMSFYERAAEPAEPPPAATILVVQADGTRVPMLQPPLQRPLCSWPRDRSRPRSGKPWSQLSTP
jgi:hypothetical protein